MNEAPFDLVVLDLDGTLVQLDVDWVRVKRRLVKIAVAYQVSLADDRLSALLSEARRLGQGPAAVAMEEALAAAEAAGVAYSPVNTALLSWLESLPPTVPVALLSLNSRETLRLVRERLGLVQRVGALVGREDVTRPKPDPEGLLTLVRRFAATPGRVLFVGDSEADLECARRAGVRGVDVGTIGVRWENHV